MVSKHKLQEAYDSVVPVDATDARQKEVTRAINLWIFKIARAAVSTLYEFKDKAVEQNASSRNVNSTPKKRQKPSPKLQDFEKRLKELEESRSSQMASGVSQEVHEQLKAKDVELQRKMDEEEKLVQRMAEMEKQNEQLCQQLVSSRLVQAQHHVLLSL